MDRRSTLKLLSLSAAAAALIGGERLVKRRRQEAEPPAVALNQAGYLPNVRKIATVPAQEAGMPFELRDEKSGHTAFRGVVGSALRDLCSGDHVAAADFSIFQTSGSYWNGG